ncbi:MAG: PQQ-like beta-propeller repeat protein, partial [Planctomycetes bacterium]|nr:PQQ-like beta-propeller repeat protein [Planctomycetota bacterium]
MNSQRNKRPDQLAARLLAVATRVVVYGSLATVAAIVLMQYMQPRLRSRVAGDAGSESQGSRQTAPATATDWPHLRGPACDGHDDGQTPLVDHWPAEGPPVLWTREFGPGYSALIVVEDRVYTQVQNLHGQYVVCLEAETGQQRWRTHYAPPYNALEQYPGPRSTPTWNAGRVYFAGPEGTVGCLNADDGSIVWNRNVLEEFSDRLEESSDRDILFGYSCSPWVEDGRVIVSVGGEEASVVALDATDGSLLWKTGDEPASYCSPMPITFDGQRQFVVFQRNAMYGIAPADGRILWETRVAPGYNPHAAAPLYEEPYLMVMLSFHKGSALYRLDKTESGHAAKFQWRRYRRMSHDVASSVLVDGCVYGFDLRDPQSRIQRPSRGKFTCMDFLTGEIRWATEAPGHSTVIAADGKLILLNDSGELILLRATPEKYDELARATVFGDERCWITPTLGQGFAYLRSPTRIACVYLGDEAKLDEQQLARVVRTSQIDQARPWNLLFLAGGEREYPAAAPSREELVVWYTASMASMAVA